MNVDMALIAYLLPFVGPGIILLTGAGDAFARFHARQSLALFGSLLVAPIVWAVAAWLLVWLPYGGALAAFLFSLVLLVYLAAIYAWLVGIRNALSGRRNAVPFFGGRFV